MVNMNETVVAYFNAGAIPSNCLRRMREGDIKYLNCTRNSNKYLPNESLVRYRYTNMLGRIAGYRFTNRLICIREIIDLSFS